MVATPAVRVLERAVDDGSAGGAPRLVPHGLTWANVRPKGRMVVRAARLWDGKSPTLRENVDVLISDGRIAGVAPKGEVTADVKVVDAPTGEDVKDAEVMWHCGWPAGVTGGSLDRAECDEETGDNVFKAPAGPIQISVGSEQHLHVYQVLQLAPGQQPMTVGL